MIALLRRKDGAAAVEFAILSPIFIVALLSMVGYAIYLSASTSVQHMTEEAARAAVGGLSTTETRTLAQQAVLAAANDRAFIDPAKVAVDITFADKGRYSVKVSYDARQLPIWSLFAQIVPVSPWITRTTVMRSGAL